jgi:hypothetical protein
MQRSVAQPLSSAFLESARRYCLRAPRRHCFEPNIYDETCGIRDHFEAGIGLKLRFLQTATLAPPG